jgi:hypothetical protein
MVGDKVAEVIEQAEQGLDVLFGYFADRFLPDKRPLSTTLSTRFSVMAVKGAIKETMDVAKTAVQLPSLERDLKVMAAEYLRNKKLLDDLAKKDPLLYKWVSAQAEAEIKDNIGNWIYETVSDPDKGGELFGRATVIVAPSIIAPAVTQLAEARVVVAGARTIRATADAGILLDFNDATVKTSSLLFTQRTGARGARFASIVSGLKEKPWIGDPVDIILTKEGLVTVDNSRVAVILSVYNEDRAIPYHLRLADELLPEATKAALPEKAKWCRTWGDVARSLMAGQNPPLPGPTSSVPIVGK